MERPALALTGLTAVVSWDILEAQLDDVAPPRQRHGVQRGAPQGPAGVEHEPAVGLVVPARQGLGAGGSRVQGQRPVALQVGGMCTVIGGAKQRLVAGGGTGVLALLGALVARAVLARQPAKGLG